MENFQTFNILYICKSMPNSYRGGIQTHTWQLARYMQQMGHGVSILTAGDSFKSTHVVNEEEISLIKLFYIPGRHIPILWLFLEEFFFNLAVLFWVIRNQKNYDIIHLQGRSGYFLPLFLKNKTIICTTHGLLENEYRTQNQFGTQMHSYIHYHLTKGLELRALKNTILIAVSESLKSDLKKIYGIKSHVEVINNGVELYKGVVSQPENGHIVFIGRIEFGKGIFDLLEALKSLPENVKLSIAGDGTARKELLEYLHTHQELAKRVSYFGAQNSSEVKTLINRSVALVLPSYRETQGIVILEANAQGRPALASNIDGINEILQHENNGLLFEAGKPESIAKSIRQILMNPNKAKQMGLNGQKMVEEYFSWSSVTIKTLAFYKNINHPEYAI